MRGPRTGALGRLRARRRADARLVALLAFALFAAAAPLAAELSAAARRASAAPPSQQRTQPRRRAQRRARPPAIDYSEFSHASPKHKGRDCNACHVVESFERPDIADYPDHPACVDCHRAQFFRGARPAICSNCHTVVGPRARARFEFPRRGEPTEFADVFPHSLHVKATSLIQFRRILGERATTTATCQHCHKPDARILPPTTGALPPARPTAAPTFPAGTYMTTPTSHATCFQCHWREDVDGREQKPLASQCAGCHANAAPTTTAGANVATTATTAADAPAVAASVNATRAGATRAARVAAASFAWPPPRVSPKFVHESVSHKKRQNEEGREVAITCLQCHAAARRAASLEAMRAKESRVRLQTCASSDCHTALTGLAQLKLSVFRELRERAREPKFDCALCHAPPVSDAPEVPCDHYAAVFASAVKEKKSTQGVERVTPERCKDSLKP